MVVEAAPTTLPFQPDPGGICARGHTRLALGGMVCRKCPAFRCVGCGIWLRLPSGLYCKGCNREA